MFYLTKIPALVKLLYPKLVWSLPNKGQSIYLTFDDGPHPVHTPFVLHWLKKYDAKATFFCIGSNVAKYPLLYNQILLQGHAVGNHTMQHINGKMATTSAYLTDIKNAEPYIATNLFRPPYGRIKQSQINEVLQLPNQYHIIMWSTLSADFDNNITPQKCLQHTIKNTKEGDIIVFHDSDKAAKNMQFVLPQALAYFAKHHFKCDKITL